MYIYYITYIYKTYTNMLKAFAISIIKYPVNKSKADENISVNY